MSKWIPIAEKQPRPLIEVLVAYRGMEGALIVDVGLIGSSGRWQYLNLDGVCIPRVEYWMDYPLPPKEQE